MHIVSYTCEQCATTHSCEAGLHCEGMCAKCGSLMRIEDLFSDRRIISLPVRAERRAEAA